MSLKKVILLILVGFTTGVVFVSGIFTLSEHSASVGGEMCFIPMVVLLVWFGWTMRTETKKAKIRRFKNGNSRSK